MDNTQCQLMQQPLGLVGITHATFDPNNIGYLMSLSNENFTLDQTSGAFWNSCRGSVAIIRDTYFEFELDTVTNGTQMLGVAKETATIHNHCLVAGQESYLYYTSSRNSTYHNNNEAFGFTGALCVSGDIVGCLVRPGVGIWWSKNGVWLGVSLQTDPDNSLNPRYVLGVLEVPWLNAMLTNVQSITLRSDPALQTFSAPSGAEGYY